MPSSYLLSGILTTPPPDTYTKLSDSSLSPRKKPHRCPRSSDSYATTLPDPLASLVLSCSLALGPWQRLFLLPGKVCYWVSYFWPFSSCPQFKCHVHRKAFSDSALPIPNQPLVPHSASFFSSTYNNLGNILCSFL